MYCGSLQGSLYGPRLDTLKSYSISSKHLSFMSDCACGGAVKAMWSFSGKQSLKIKELGGTNCSSSFC